MAHHKYFALKLIPHHTYLAYMYNLCIKTQISKLYAMKLLKLSIYGIYLVSFPRQA
jgi:hypothetical protein